MSARTGAAQVRGFTILELLVVMAIIAVLLGLLVPALSAARKSTGMANELAAARQLMVAYQNYTIVNNGMVPPGYSTSLSAYDQSGEPVQPAVVAGRYVWRLLPYLDFTVRGLYVNENRALLERFEGEDPELYRYALSLFPSLGLNTSWLGGDQRDNAFDELMLEYFGRYYITRITTARRPSDLIAFASARGRDVTGTIDGLGTFEGNYYIWSRTFITTRWQKEYDPLDPPIEYGNLSLRYNGSAVTAFLDGHTDALPEAKLRDMRHWADQADSPDWKLQPRF